MMNTLANHKFLPHDGKNLTKEVVVAGLAAALNFDPALGSLMFDMAVIANPQPNATFFTLWVFPSIFSSYSFELLFQG